MLQTSWAQNCRLTQMWRICLLSEIRGTIICKPDKQADYREDMCLWVTLSRWTAVLVWIICLLTDNLKNCLAIKRGHPDTEGNAHSITLSRQLLAISCQMQGKFCAISAQLRLTSYFYSSGTEPFANTGFPTVCQIVSTTLVWQIILESGNIVKQIYGPAGVACSQSAANPGMQSTCRELCCHRL